MIPFEAVRLDFVDRLNKVAGTVSSFEMDLALKPAHNYLTIATQLSHEWAR
jgi:hypothetical protein